ncbi:MAG: roadblock/LC7 domain-containing protein [Chloroflexota bacterium]|nr:roadblock/LC7 domain-containing protein [Chloroflexota bacterium]
MPTSPLINQPSEAAAPAEPGRSGMISSHIRQDHGERGDDFIPHFDFNLSDIVIDEDTSAAIATVLSHLLRDSGADSGVVLDRAGQIIVWDGDEYRNEMMMLGALIAGTYASTREMARILGEDNFRMLLQEGSKGKIFTEAIGDQWLISVIFSQQTHLGLVKMLCGRATQDLSQVLIKSVETNRLRPRRRDAGLARVTQDTIDLIFRDEPTPT